MIIRKLKDSRASGRLIESTGWRSNRLILKDDEMGFSFHLTTIFEGAELEMHYRNHFESVFCISGEGTIEDLATGEVHPIEPGTLYALDKHDRHILRGATEMLMACVFNPPLTGQEVHDEAGAYPPAEELV